MDLHVVILAAGRSTRMKSAIPKVLHAVAGRTLIDRVLDAVRLLEPATTTVVVGHGADAVRAHLAGRADLQFVLQDPQLGTGHAVLQTAPLLRGRTGTMVLLSGDVPMLRSSTLSALVETHQASSASATVLTAVVERPYGYGRIVRNAGRLTRIAEERDATTAQRAITEINAGIYAFALEPLFDALERIGTQNAQGEYYLPDLIAIYRRRRRAVATFTVPDAREIVGVNSRSELAEVAKMVRQQKNEELMAAGVTLVDPATTYIDADVEVGPDTVIHPCVFIERGSRIGSACEIHAGARIVHSTIGDRAIIRNHSVISDSAVAAGASIGPFAHLRPGADVGQNARIGNFVEVKNTTVGPGSKASHLAYLGDATIGAGANIGAGTITCNYDGFAKHRTDVGDRVFVGSNVTLVAPVTLQRDAYVAAGSVVTDDVPKGALAIARGRQENKDGWVDRTRKERGL
jgi:bifunctional UDP-N-acetylglucosamine pyrophosphorylase/glucosamine-1-phosphate N-acetyltransferase